MARLTDNEIRIWALRVGKPSWRPWRVTLESHGGDDGLLWNALTIYALGFVAQLYLPRIIQPYRREVQAVYWDADTIARLGRDWYWDVERREYGFCISDGHFSLYYGIQPGDSRRDQSWSCFLPWTQWRFVRFSLYQPDGSHFWTEFERDRKRGIEAYATKHEMEEKVGKSRFRFHDFDGEEITATTHVEEREWLFGDKWCSWLSWFRKPKISRSLSLAFSSEVGREKGSWKGGTVGHGIEMLPNETPEQAFRRYCEQDHRSKSGKYRLTFLGTAD